MDNERNGECTKDHYNQWKELYEFNKTLPESRKIQVVGVDIEQQPENAFKYMYAVLPQKEVPEEIVDIINELKVIYEEKKFNENEIKELCENLKKDIEDNRIIYEEYLDSNFFGFMLVNDNILCKFQAYDASAENDPAEIREKRIYENFKQVCDRLPKGKYYGQWGACHVYQKQTDDVKCIAAAMNDEDSSLKVEIITIIYVYDNCTYMKKDKKRDNNLIYFVSSMHNFNSELDTISNFAKDGCTLFKVNGNNSPFENELIWPLNGYDKLKDGVTTDYFQ